MRGCGLQFSESPGNRARISGLTTICLGAVLIAGCSRGSPDCARPDIWCAGLVTDFGSVAQGINEQAWLALKEAKADGLLAQADRIETVDSRDRAANIASFGDAGYDIVITVGASIADETAAAAKRYPDVAYIGVEQSQSVEIPNLAVLVFHEESAGFLAGALAKAVSRTGNVAAVCEASFVDSIREYCEGFRAGALYRDPAARVHVAYREGHNELLFHDDDWGREAALEMVRGGADVVFAAGAETADAALEAAAGQGALVIGTETDAYAHLRDIRPFVLTSAVNDVRTGVRVLLDAAFQGRLPAGEYLGQTDLAPFHELESRVPAEAVSSLAKIRALIDAGEIPLEVPDRLP